MLFEIYPDETGQGFCWRLRDVEHDEVLAESGFAYETPEQAQSAAERVQHEAADAVLVRVS